MDQTEHATAIVVGNPDDPHAAAVASRLAGWGVTHLVIDVASLATARFTVDSRSARICKAGERPVTVQAGTRGWLRRIAPEGWQHGVAEGSQEAAVGAAWMMLLGSVVRCSGITWLTTPDRAFAAENKLVQYRAAQALSIHVPDSVVTSEPAEASALLGDRFVVKPLGPGQFFDDGTGRAVFTSVVTASDPALRDLGGAPFIAQRFVQADRHLRVVTVRDQVWVSALEAAGSDTDWRRTPAAHQQFRPIDQAEVGAAAVRLAEAVEVGYSSQDWVESDGQAWFLDLNPAGQCLFLHDPTSGEVAEAIASWLATDE